MIDACMCYNNNMHACSVYARKNVCCVLCDTAAFCLPNELFFVVTRMETNFFTGFFPVFFLFQPLDDL